MKPMIVLTTHDGGTILVRVEDISGVTQRPSSAAGEPSTGESYVQFESRSTIRVQESCHEILRRMREATSLQHQNQWVPPRLNINSAEKTSLDIQEQSREQQR